MPSSVILPLNIPEKKNDLAPLKDPGSALCFALFASLFFRPRAIAKKEGGRRGGRASEVGV